LPECFCIGTHPFFSTLKFQYLLDYLLNLRLHLQKSNIYIYQNFRDKNRLFIW
jgi:hypothetical protein